MKNERHNARDVNADFHDLAPAQEMELSRPTRPSWIELHKQDARERDFEDDLELEHAAGDGNEPIVPRESTAARGA